MKTIIYNADIANEGRLTRGYIVIDDEIIAEVGEGEPAAAVWLNATCATTSTERW